MSKKTIRVSAGVAASLAAVATLTACGTSGETPAENTDPLVYIIPSSWANFPGLQENIDKFTEETGIEVEVQGIPDGSYDENLRARLASGDSVDIFSGLGDEKDPGSFMVEITDPSFKDRLAPHIFDSLLAQDGKLYSVPTADGLSTFGVFYNKDVFEAAGVTEAPETLDDLTLAFEAVKTSGVTPLFVSGKDGWTLLQHRNAVDANFLAADPELGDRLASNESTWAEIPGFTEQHETLRSWATGGLINPDFLTASYEQALAAVADGSAGALINGSWVIGPLRGNAPDANLGFFALPSHDGETVIGLSPPSQMHIAKSSKNPEEALELLEFLIDPAQAEPYLAQNSAIPALTDVAPSDADPVLADIQKYLDAEQSGLAFDSVVKFPTPQDDIIAAYQELLAARIDVAEFANRYDTAWQTSGKAANLSGF